MESHGKHHFLYKELSVDDKFFPVKSAINQMSRWKDQLISPAEALTTPARDTKGALCLLYTSGIPFTLLYNVTSALMRARGDSKRPLYFLLVASVLNLSLIHI